MRPSPRPSPRTRGEGARRAGEGSSLLAFLRVLRGLIHLLLQVVHRLLSVAVFVFVLRHFVCERGELGVVLFQQRAVVGQRRILIRGGVFSFLHRLRVAVEHLLVHLLRLLVFGLFVSFFCLLLCGVHLRGHGVSHLFSKRCGARGKDLSLHPQIFLRVVAEIFGGADVSRGEFRCCAHRL